MAAEYSHLMEYLNVLSIKYRTVSLGTLGASIMGREIPVVTLGGRKSSPGVIYVGGFRGDDVMTPSVLLRFISDYAECLEAGGRTYSVSLPSLYEMRTVHVIPMLNPDGYVIRREGVSDIPNGDALREKNGDEDFSSWRYNARGADLTRSFCKGAGGGWELTCASDPEVSALTKYVGMASVGVLGEIKLALSLTGEGGGIRYRSGYSAPRARTIWRLLERMTGEAGDPGELTRGGFSEWFAGEISRPAFDVGCMGAEDYVNLYTMLREALFSSPLLI